MRASRLVLWGSLSVLAPTLSAGGCGGRAEVFAPGENDDGGDGSSGSSSGVSGSSSGPSGSSSGFSGSSSGPSGSSSGFSGSSSGISGSSSGFSGSSSGPGNGYPNGFININDCTGSAAACGAPPFQVDAAFYTMDESNVGCTGTPAGSCIYYSCPGQVSPQGVSAGAITVSGGLLTTPATMTPLPGGNEYSYFSSSPGYTAGQTLSVSASGATVPAFGPELIVAPALTQLTSPALALDGGTTVIPTGADLPLTWSGGQPDATMLFEVLAMEGRTWTYCTWNGSDDHGTVPAAALKPFSGMSAYVTYGQFSEASFYAGPFSIAITVLPFTAVSANFQ